MPLAVSLWYDYLHFQIATLKIKKNKTKFYKKHTLTHQFEIFETKIKEKIQYLYNRKTNKDVFTQVEN